MNRPSWELVIKAGLGPLAGVMGLYYLSNWLGGVREDSLVHRLTVMGGAVLLLATLALAAVATRVAPADFRHLLALAAAVKGIEASEEISIDLYLFRAEAQRRLGKHEDRVRDLAEAAGARHGPMLDE